MNVDSQRTERTAFYPQFAIRSAAESEFAALLDVQAESLRGNSCDRYSSVQIASLVKGQQVERERRDELLLVAELAGEIVGFAAIAPDRPRLGGLYVLPEHTRQGIGTALLKAAETRVRTRNERVMLVLSSMVAVEFYQAQGYRYIERTGFYATERVWVPCVQMRKPLVTLNPFEQWWEEWVAPWMGEFA